MRTWAELDVVVGKEIVQLDPENGPRYIATTGGMSVITPETNREEPDLPVLVPHETLHGCDLTLSADDLSFFHLELAVFFPRRVFTIAIVDLDERLHGSSVSIALVAIESRQDMLQVVVILTILLAQLSSFR